MLSMASVFPARLDACVSQHPEGLPERQHLVLKKVLSVNDSSRVQRIHHEQLLLKYHRQVGPRQMGALQRLQGPRPPAAGLTGTTCGNMGC